MYHRLYAHGSPLRTIATVNVADSCDGIKRRDEKDSKYIQENLQVYQHMPVPPFATITTRHFRHRILDIQQLTGLLLCWSPGPNIIVSIQPPLLPPLAAPNNCDIPQVRKYIVRSFWTSSLILITVVSRIHPMCHAMRE